MDLLLCKFYYIEIHDEREAIPLVGASHGDNM